MYPGMRVKRWVVLAFVSMGVIALATLYGVGPGRVSVIYRWVAFSPPGRIAVAIALLIVGAGGFSYSLMRLVRSIARGVAPTVLEKPSAIIYRTRVLGRGPKVVAIGGGTGLSTLLRGIKHATSNITAIVTVTDDGGSSGRLREEIDVLPPGDVRNCLLALAEDESRLSDYFQYRFEAPAELAGHSLGNLVLAGLEQATGGFDRAIEAMSHFLSIQGRVVPSTLAKTHLVARMDDGETVEGESRIGADPRKIAEIWLSSGAVPAYGSALDAIHDADLILFGPGSLYTSLIPNLLVSGISDAIRAAPAEKVLVANLMTQPSETTGFSLADHLEVLNAYVDVRAFHLLLVNNRRPEETLLDEYLDEAAEPVIDDLRQNNAYGLTIVREDLIGVAAWSGKETIKHDPDKLVRAIFRHTKTFARRAAQDDRSRRSAQRTAVSPQR